jgi:lysophospholipase L1-like esterase
MAAMILPLLTALLIAPAASADTLPVHVGGRTAPAGDGSLRFGWPAVYFEGRFRGTGVEVAAESGTEFMRITVDGEEKAVLKRPGAARLQLRGLAHGEHVIRLEKQTESQSGGGRFLGFRALDGGEPLPPRPRTRRIEFIGDSYTVGYGNTSPVRACPGEGVHDTTDTQRAFGPLLANKLGADYRIVAWSGRGIVRNYNGAVPGETLPVVYRRLLPDDPSQLDTAAGAWRPQLIVVNLGTNDFSTPLNAGERWKDQAELRADYRRRYTAFARELIAKQPQAKLILMGSDAFFGEVRQVAAALNAGGARRATALRFGDLELTGCDYHPSLEDHRRLAALLETTIAAQPDLWTAPAAQ